MTIVVVSPHRDDAAFSLGLAIEAWLAEGHTVSVLNCFTQSAFAPYSDVETLHPNDRVSFVSALRRREDQAWNKLLGSRLSFHDLDLLDAPLRLACAEDEVLRVDIRAGDRALARVAGAVAKLARKAPSQGLAIVGPLALGGHIDHRVVRQAIVQASAQAAVPLAFYEDLPYAARDGEAEDIEVRATETLPDLTAVFASSATGAQVGAVKRKTRMAECYDSQVDSAAIESMAEFSTRYRGRERLWANVRWRESSIATDRENQA